MSSTFYLIGQFLTLISYIIYWLSRFRKTKKNILFFDNISRFFAIIAFIFLKTYDGIKGTLYVVLRNSVGRKIDKKSKKIKQSTFILMLILLIIMYSLGFNGISTIFIATCNTINLYGVLMLDEQGIRKCGMIGAVLYTGFMIFTKNITGTICEIIGLLVMLISYLKYKK